MCFLGGRTLHTCSSEGPFFNTFLMQNAYLSNMYPKYGGAWPFHSGIIMVAWWRPRRGLYGLNLGQNSRFKLAAASGRAPGASGILSEPRVVPDACPLCGQLVHNSCSPRVHLVFTLWPASANLAPNSCPPCSQLVPNSCPSCGQLLHTSCPTRVHLVAS